MAINRIKTGGITDGTIQSGDLAPGTIASDRIAPGTIANDRLANNTITINGTSIALGASGDIVAGTDWQAVTVADGSTTVNTVAGGGYLLDTNAGIIEAFLPSSPTRGDTVVIVDYSGTFATNRCIVNTGGENIDSTVGNEFQLNTNNTVAEFIYIDSSKGWLVKLNQAAGTTPSFTGNEAAGVYNRDAEFIVATGGTITTSGDYKTHIFTGDGCFAISQLGGGTTPCAVASGVDYLVVAGGGGGGGPCGSPSQGGGGGAGGFRLSNSVCTPNMSPLSNPTGLTVSATTYPVTVGAGGAAIVTGSNSVFSTITSAGGGDGGGNNPSGPSTTAGSGGSGGGASGGNGVVGSGNTPPVSPPQGNPGGTGFDGTTINTNGGGGGGAGAAGSNSSSAVGGNGGIGSYIGDTFVGPTAPSYGTPGPVGSTRYFAGGGGGATNAPGGTQGTGGAGGGGSTPSSNPADANTGGGGFSNATGGSGIVMIRYKYQ